MRTPITIVSTLIFSTLIVVACLTRTNAQDSCPEQGPISPATGAQNLTCPCFAIGEQAGVVFELPADEYPVEILRVGIVWGSQLGGSPQSLESAINIYAGGLPDPGDPIFSLPGPVLTDGFVNEFDISPIPGDKVIDSGPFTVTLRFANANAGQIFNPSVVNDANGCTPGRNIVFAIPGGWNDACALGVTGDWRFQIVYRSVECETQSGPKFIRGDSNTDGRLDLSDAVLGLNVLLLGAASLCREAMDANGDETHDVSDAVYSLAFLFTGGPEPVTPYPACGDVFGGVDLGCESPPSGCL